MPDKAYAILYRRIEGLSAGNLYFPIKRNDSLNYAGMPQFFGGTQNSNESDRETIAREMLEESNNQIILKSGGLNKIYQSDVLGSKYNFYVAMNFSGENFLGRLENNLEMKSIQKFYALDGESDTIEDLLQRLGIIESIPFAQSETYTAFTEAIKWVENENWRE